MRAFLAICLVALCGFLFLKNSSQNRRICDMSGDTIITLGDSLANGYGVSENDSFAIKTALGLQKRAIKRGIDGEISAGLLSRIDSELNSQNLAAIIISIGGNDFLRKIDKATTERNIREIVRKAKAKTTCVVLLGVPDGLLGGLTGGVSSIYTDIAKSEGVLLEKSAMPKILKQHSLKIDEIHPNSEGHAIIAENIAKLIMNAK